MSRGTYAFRDLDEEHHAFVEEERDQYEPHHSPPDAKSKTTRAKSNLNGLSESTMLKTYVDHHKAQRRRTILGGAFVVGVALLGVAPMLLEMESANTDSALELALSAPYRSIRLRGVKDPLYDPLAHDDDDDDEGQRIGQEPEVGDADPHDTGAGGDAALEKHGDEATQDDAPLDSLDTEDAHIPERQTLTLVADTKRLRVIANDVEEEEDDEASDET